MGNIILNTNAIPLYGFLSVINGLQSKGDAPIGKKILDCGAGGQKPPLALFRQHGYETWGIDFSNDQLEKALDFCRENELVINLQKGDMRHMHFDRESFDYVYEHFSMCHLSKSDTVLAIDEMFRVIKRRGICFLGVISTDSWPKSLFGKEKEPGEFWSTENSDDEPHMHSMFTDEEADCLVSDWEILAREKRVLYNIDRNGEISLEKWMEFYGETDLSLSSDKWRNQYDNRANYINYTHLYYILRKVRT